MNSEFTRYASHQDPSTIDHILTNRPLLLSNKTTETNIISDHCSLILKYNFKPDISPPKFNMKRNFNLLTIDKLRMAVAKNIKLQNLTQLTDPNLIAETLHNELNFIIDTLAPQKRVIRNKITCCS